MLELYLYYRQPIPKYADGENERTSEGVKEREETLIRARALLVSLFFQMMLYKIHMLERYLYYRQPIPKYADGENE